MKYVMADRKSKACQVTRTQPENKCLFTIISAILPKSTANGCSKLELNPWSYKSTNWNLSLILNSDLSYYCRMGSHLRRIMAVSAQNVKFLRPLLASDIYNF